jgi:hypothetical protein
MTKMESSKFLINRWPILILRVIKFGSKCWIMLFTFYAVGTDPLVPVSQMLLDVVSVYNRVTDLTDRKQAVKISISGAQVCFASTLAMM